MGVSKLELEVYRFTQEFIFSLNEKLGDDSYKLEVSENSEEGITFSIFKESEIEKIERYVSCSIPKDKSKIKRIYINKNKVYGLFTLRQKENKIASSYLNFLTEKIPKIKSELTYFNFD